MKRVDNILFIYSFFPIILINILVLNLVKLHHHILEQQPPEKAHECWFVTHTVYSSLLVDSRPPWQMLLRGSSRSLVWLLGLTSQRCHYTGATCCICSADTHRCSRQSAHQELAGSVSRHGPGSCLGFPGKEKKSWRCCRRLGKQTALGKHKEGQRWSVAR